MRERLRVFGAVIREPALRRIELAFLGFNMAEYATWIAMLVYAYGRGGAAAAGAIAIIQLIPATIVAPLAAYAGDRFRRDRVLLAAYIAQSLALGATALALSVDAPISFIYATAAASAVSMTFTRPAQGSLLPSVTRTPEHLTAANVASGVIEGTGIMLGPLTAGVLLQVSGPAAVFGVFAAVMVLGAALVARLPIDPSAMRVATVTSSSDVWRETLGGFRALRHESAARTVVLVLSSSVLMFGALDVLFVAVAIDLLGLGEAGAGYLNSAFGAGGIVGAAATVTLVGRARLTPPIAGAAGITGAPIALVAAVPSPASAPILLAVGGGGRSVLDVAGRTLLQRVAPDEVLSRVFGVLEGLAMLALALGSAFSSILIEAFGIRVALLATGAVVPLVVLLSGRRLLAIDRETEAPDPESLELLRGIEIFAPLPASAFERLVRNLVPMQVEAGVALIREGEPGDRVYVIADGTAEVTIAGRRIAEVGRGDHVGEIALLRDKPRTATVMATTAMRVLALEREPFLEAVTGHPQSGALARAVVDERLEGTRVQD